MPYDNLRNNYLESREYFTTILRNSKKLGLPDSRILYLLKQEGLMGKNLYAILSDNQLIEEGKTGLIVTPKKVELDKSMTTSHLDILRQDIEEIQEALELANGEVGKNIIEAVTNYHDSLNEIDKILTHLILEDISTKKTE